MLNMVQEENVSMTKIRRSISFDEELLEWIDHYVNTHYEYKDRSHFVEVLVRRFKDNVEEVKTGE